MSIHDYLPNDNYKPLVAKPSLQQYDNYQIHDLYCDDIIYQPLNIGDQVVPAPAPVLFKNFLAVEKVSPAVFIECNFEAIAIQYP